MVKRGASFGALQFYNLCGCCILPYYCENFLLKKIRPSFLPGIIWLVIVTILLIIPGSAFPQENWLSRIWFDKWVHVGLFAIMVTLWCWASLRFEFETAKLQKAFMIIVFACLVYGIGMEFVQKHLVVNRSFDNGDIIADGIGCALGWLISSRRYIKK